VINGLQGRNKEQLSFEQEKKDKETKEQHGEGK
jgi:hypothetical protein